jgi:hypothetical protein
MNCKSLRDCDFQNEFCIASVFRSIQWENVASNPVAADSCLRQLGGLGAFSEIAGID